MSIIENKLRAYLAALDGAPKDFSTIAHPFDELYHNEFTLQDKGSIATREQMKRIHAKAFELGSKATALYCSASSDVIEYKFHLVNEYWDTVIHCIATVKDDKIYKSQSVEGSKALLLRNFQAYTSECDGTPKPFSEVSHLFDEVYHNDFVLQSGSNIIGKQQVKQLHADSLALGTKVTLVLFKEVGTDCVEYKQHVVNDKVDLFIHNIAKVKDNKFISAEPVTDAAVESVTEIYQDMSVKATNQTVSAEHAISAPQ
jgi:hypothetical protein